MGEFCFIFYGQYCISQASQIATFSATVYLRHRVLNLSIVRHNQLHPIPFVIFMVGCIMDFVMRRGISDSVVVILATFKETIFQVMLLRELTRSWLLLLLLLHQRVLFLAPTQVRIISMLLPLIWIRRGLMILL